MWTTSQPKWSPCVTKWLSWREPPLRGRPSWTRTLPSFSLTGRLMWWSHGSVCHHSVCVCICVWEKAGVNLCLCYDCLGEKENSLKTDDYGRDLSSVQTLLTKQVWEWNAEIKCNSTAIKTMWDTNHIFYYRCIQEYYLILKLGLENNKWSFAVRLHILSLTVGNIWCWTSGIPAGGHHQHHCAEGSASGSQTRAVQSHWGSSRYTDETLEPAAVQLCSSQEEAAGGSGTLQKGKNAHLTQHLSLTFSHLIQRSSSQSSKLIYESLGFREGLDRLIKKKSSGKTEIIFFKKVMINI